MSYNLDEFGKVFIDSVRDNTIDNFERMFDGRMKGLTAEEVRDKLSLFDDYQKSILLWMIAKAVDQCMHNMLFMLEEHEEIRILFDKEDIIEESDGLAGELYTEDGWIKKYSKKKFND